MFLNNLEPFRPKRKLKKSKRSRRKKKRRSCRSSKSKCKPWKSTPTTSLKMVKIPRFSTKCTWITFWNWVKKKTIPITTPPTKNPVHTHSKAVKWATMANLRRLLWTTKIKMTTMTIPRQPVPQLTLEDLQSKMTNKWLTFQDVTSLNSKLTWLRNTVKNNSSLVSRSLRTTVMSPTRWTESRS